MKFGEQIKKAREAAQMTQEQLGAAIGVTGVTIMRYEKNQRQPRFEQLQAIAKALNIEFWELFDPVIAKALEAIVDNNIKSVDEAIRKKYGIVGDFVVIEVESKDSSVNEKDLTIYKLLEQISKLNEEGEKVAIQRIEELTQLPKYQRTEPPETLSADGEYTDTTQKEKPSEGAETPTGGNNES